MSCCTCPKQTGPDTSNRRQTGPFRSYGRHIDGERAQSEPPYMEGSEEVSRSNLVAERSAECHWLIRTDPLGIQQFPEKMVVLQTLI